MVKSLGVGALDVFSIFVLLVLVAVVLVVLLWAAQMPGKIARKRNHPQADAVNVAGWLGVLTMGIVWPFAAIWAFYKPRAAGEADELDALRKRIDDLERRLSAGEGGRS